MAGPEMAIAGMGMSVLSGVVKASGLAESAGASAGMHRYTAGVARVNQQIAKQNAAYARAVGESEAQISGMKTRFQVGTTKVAQSGRGLDVNTGSPAAVRESEIEVGQHNEAIIRANAARKAFGFETEAFNKGVEAEMHDKAATNIMKASEYDQISNILGTSTDVASKWLTYKQNFPGTGYAYDGGESGSE